MKIRRIILNNLHSIRDRVEIDFTKQPLNETGIFAITGDTGAGKTTILDAITLSIYGNICRQSDAREALSHGAVEGYAECEYEAKGRRFLSQWRVKQTKSKKPGLNLKTERSVAEWDEKSGKFHVIAERKVREVNDFVEEITGLDFARFTRSVLLAQGEFAAFLKANEKERSDLLERITGTEIYSELSIAALERKNLEKFKLDALAEKRENLQILAPEEIKEKKVTLKINQENHKKLVADLEKNKSEYNRINQINNLEISKEAIINKLTSLAIQIEDLSPKIAQLELYKKALPLYPTLARFDDKNQELTHCKNQIQLMENELVTLEFKIESQKNLLDNSQLKFDKKKKEQAGFFKLIDQVIAIDINIKNFEAVCQKLEEEHNELILQISQIETEKREATIQLDDQQESINAINKWIQDNQELNQLPQDIPTISHIRNELNNNFLIKEQQKKNLEISKKKYELTIQIEEDVIKELENKNKEAEALISEFVATSPPEYASDRNNLLEKLNAEIENISKNQHFFSQLERLNEKYQSIIAEINDTEIILANLRNEELFLDKRFLTSLELCEDAEKALQFKQEIYRQQQSLANYEKDRALLKEGEPCPLCLSTEHPFRTVVFEPFEDLAKKELDEAESYYQKQQTERNSLLQRHVEIATAIQQIDSGTNGQLVKLKNQLTTVEEELAQLADVFDAEDFSSSVGEKLIFRISNFENELNIKKEKREKLTELNQKISKVEQAIKNLQLKLKDVQMERQVAKNTFQNIEQNISDNEKKFDQQVQQLNKIVGKYGYTFNIDSAKEMFSELTSKERLFKENQTQYAHLEKQISLSQQSISQLQKTIKNLQEKEIKIGRELKEEKLRLQTIKDERNQLFSEKDPILEKEKFITGLELLEKETSQVKDVYEETKKDTLIKKEALKAESNRLLSIKKELEKQEDLLNKGLAKMGLPNIEALRHGALTEKEAEDLQHQINQVRQTEIETRQQLKSKEEELKALKSSPASDKPLETLQTEIKLLENQSNAIQQEIGAIQQQLKDNDERKKEAKELVKQSEEQRKVYNRWMALYDLIGSSDGKKFRVFAQGLTLQKLVQLANIHLENLNGRYMITKRKGEDLELDIVDTYQADNVRSMATLSGGESFLVSLSLALGLSDLAGKNANIKSLFIDEGFGTLDDQTLDLALVTLENLQAKGKTIGIISHVKELKERISTQIRVVKKGGGMSQVEIIG